MSKVHYNINVNTCEELGRLQFKMMRQNRDGEQFLNYWEVI